MCLYQCFINLKFPFSPDVLSQLDWPTAVVLKVQSPDQEQQHYLELLEMQVIRPQPRPTKSEPLHLNKTCKWFCCALKFKNDWSTLESNPWYGEQLRTTVLVNIVDCVVISWLALVSIVSCFIFKALQNGSLQYHIHVCKALSMDLQFSSSYKVLAIEEWKIFLRVNTEYAMD